VKVRSRSDDPSRRAARATVLPTAAGRSGAVVVYPGGSGGRAAHVGRAGTALAVAASVEASLAADPATAHRHLVEIGSHRARVAARPAVEDVRSRGDAPPTAQGRPCCRAPNCAHAAAAHVDTAGGRSAGAGQPARTAVVHVAIGADTDAAAQDRPGPVAAHATVPPHANRGGKEHCGAGHPAPATVRQIRVRIDARGAAKSQPAVADEPAGTRRTRRVRPRCRRTVIATAAAVGQVGADVHATAGTDNLSRRAGALAGTARLAPTGGAPRAGGALSAGAAAAVVAALAPGAARNARRVGRASGVVRSGDVRSDRDVGGLLRRRIRTRDTVRSEHDRNQ
jgi:hypothetical protein